LGVEDEVSSGEAPVTAVELDSEQPPEIHEMGTYSPSQYKGTDSSKHW
jgi:hypothetical protein